MAEDSTRIIDISTSFNEGVPVWPKSTGVNLEWTRRVERGEGSNLTRLDTDIHVGTHVEGPLHSFASTQTIDRIALERLVGRAFVAHFPAAAQVGPQELEAAEIPKGTVRLLMCTHNSEEWKTNPKEFNAAFVGLTPEGAQWVVDYGIKLVGNDYLSIGAYGQGPAVHEILFKNDVVVVEGLNLAGVSPGEYEFICLPLKLLGREGAPARAILRQ